MRELRYYKEEFSCNGIDARYQIMHMLDCKDIIIQLYNADNGITIHDSEYSFERLSGNTGIIDFIKTPIAQRKYVVLLIALT